MIDQIETPVRDALRLRSLQIPDEVTARLRSAEYHPRSARWTTPVSLGAGAGATATAATVISVVVLGGSSPAFAGWSPTPTPTAAASSQVASAEAACQARLASQGAPPASQGAPAASQGLTPVLTDVRGPYTVAIYAKGTSSMTCFTGPSFTVVSSNSSDGAERSASGSMSVSGPGGGTGQPPTGQVSGSAFSIGPSTGNGTAPANGLQVSGAHFTLPDGSAYTLVDGQAGSSVTGATLVLDNGQKVQATTSGGWFEAWWPGSATASTAEVATAGGTVTEQLPAWTTSPGPGGNSGSSGAAGPGGAA